MKNFENSIFRFRQDLRIFDNLWLQRAIENSKTVTPLFIFDEAIIAKSLKKDPRLWFLIEAVEKLAKELESRWSHLIVKFWNPRLIVPEIVKDTKSDAIFCSKSYWINSKTRDIFISNRAKEHSVYFEQVEDFLLVPLAKVEQRKVFTPFFNKWIQHIPENYDLVENKNILSKKIPEDNWKKQLEKAISQIDSWKNKYRSMDFSVQRLKEFDFTNYENTRNFPYEDGSSKLSPYLRFWLLSVRELYNTVKNKSQTYVKELARREFWQHINYYFPESNVVEFQEKRRNLKRENNEKFFEAWKNWKTGYPIIDAGMRQLKEENRIHNRVRMIVASFLTKDLLIDRRWWEKHFANYLIDYDENVNIGNRQRSASVGADPKPIRIFSPILQSQRFDPQTHYIKKYIPELKNILPGLIHDPTLHDLPYEKPIIIHKNQLPKAKNMYYQNNTLF